MEFIEASAQSGLPECKCALIPRLSATAVSLQGDCSAVLFVDLLINTRRGFQAAGPIFRIWQF